MAKGNPIKGSPVRINIPALIFNVIDKALAMRLFLTLAKAGLGSNRSSTRRYFIYTL